MTRVHLGAGVNFYVAEDGDDSWSGRIKDPNAQRTDGPLKTIQRALDLAERGDTVYIRGGRYYEVSVSLGPRHSGITLAAAPGESPVLYGGRRITGWRRDGDQLYSADLPPVRNGSWDFRLLVVNDTYRPRARWPKNGRLTHDSTFNVSWMGTNAGGWARKPTHEELTTMVYRSGDLGHWLDVRSAEIQVFHMWDDSIVGVESVDHESRRVIFSSEAGCPPGAFPWCPETNTYVVWNIKEGMHEPGCWYLDKTEGKVVYWPKPGEDMTSMDVIAPTAEHIIRICGASDVAIRGLELAVTNAPVGSAGFGALRLGGALSVEKGTNILISEVKIRNTGGLGMKLNDVQCCAVERSRVYATGAGGISIRGKDCRIEDNVFRKVGVDYPSAMAVHAAGTRMKVSHNEVVDAPYCGIGLGGSDHFVEKNVVTDVMKVLADGAGIYANISNSLIRSNKVMDINRHASHAYYLDEMSHGCIVEGNLSVDVGSPFQFHMTSSNVIRGCVFVSDGNITLRYPKSKDETFENNIVYAKGKITLQNPDAVTAMVGNVFYSESGELTQQTTRDGESKVEPLELTGGSTAANPLFRDVKGGDFRFTSESPALTLGIQPIDLAGVGPRPQRAES